MELWEWVVGHWLPEVPPTCGMGRRRFFRAFWGRRGGSSRWELIISSSTFPHS